MRAVVAFAGLLVLLPVSAAQSGLIFGTEELPELPDGSGDVSYPPTWVASRDHGYIDFQAAWFNYSAPEDEILFVLKTGDATPLTSPPSGYSIVCTVNGTVGRGDLAFDWRIFSNESQVRSSVRFAYAPGPGSNIVDAVPHSFAAALEDPGYFKFRLPRSDVLKLGDQIENPQGACVEYLAATVPDGPAGGGSFTAVPPSEDRAAANSVYSFLEVRRLRSPDGVVDPIEEFERNNATAAPTTATLENETRTPFVGLSTALAILGGLALLRRREQ